MADAREKIAELLQELEDLPFGTYLEEADHLIVNDVLPVVRCKDCGHYHKNVCPIWCYTETKPNDFCSYGERRTDV